MLEVTFELTINPARLNDWADTRTGLDVPMSLLGRAHDHRRYPVLRATADGDVELTHMVQGWSPSLLLSERRELAGYVPQETIGSVLRYRHAFAERRCIVPADRINNLQHGSLPHRGTSSMSLHSGEVFGIAGIWEENDDGMGGCVSRFSIITTLPSTAMHLFADRTPVVISLRDRKCWLGLESKEMPDRLLRPLSEEELRLWNVTSGAFLTLNESGPT